MINLLPVRIRELKFNRITLLVADACENHMREDVEMRNVECILQTNERAMCCVAVEGQLDASFHNHRSRWIRRFFRCPKYYRLEYTAMVGEKKYTVSTVY